MKYLSFDGLSHFLSKLVGEFSPLTHTHKKSDITDLTVDSSLSSTSTNPVQNKVVNTALNARVPTSRTVNGKVLSANITLSASDVGADASGTAATKANEALASAKSYTDTKVADLVDSAPDTLNTLNELATAIQEHEDITDALDSAITKKVDKVDGKGLSTNDYTTTEKNKLAGIATGAEVNQNAFSTITVGSTAIAADSKTDTFTIAAGSNITLTPDTTNDKMTIAATDTKYSAGTGISLSGTTFSNSGVRSIATGSSNGTISVNTGGTTADVAVKGLGSAAYTASTAYDASGAANTALTEAKAYTDGQVTTKADIANGQYTATASSTDGVAYTATVPSITSLTAGVSFIMIPSTVSTSTTPTLNVNSLGAKNIRRRLSSISTSAQAGNSASWLAANKPFRVTYDGTQWIVEGQTRPVAGDLYGTLAVAKGGTGATDAATALTNLGAAAADHTHTYSDVGAAAASHSHSNYAATSHTHSPKDITPYYHNILGTSGTAGYALVATLTVTNTYANAPITIVLSQRNGKSTCRLYIYFTSTNSTDPTLGYFKFDGHDYGCYLYKSATSTWELYVKKSEAYDQVCVVDYTKPYYMNGTNITWETTQVSSLPDGATQATAALKFSLSGTTLTITDDR